MPMPDELTFVDLLDLGQEECARFVARRKILRGRLLTHRVALEQAAEAYRLFDTQTTGKGVFVTVP